MSQTEIYLYITRGRLHLRRRLGGEDEQNIVIFNIITQLYSTKCLKRFSNRSRTNVLYTAYIKNLVLPKA